MDTNTLNIFTIWISFLIVNPLLFWAIKDRKSSWGKYWLIFFATAVLTGLLVYFLSSSPQSYSSFMSQWINVTNTSG